MSSIQINVPDETKRFMEAQATSRGFGSASDYILALVEADRLRDVREDVEAMLLEAIDGPFEDWTNTDVEDIRRVGKALIERRKRQR